MTLVSLIIPCYNEQESLPRLYAELDEVSRQMDAFSF